MTVTPESTIDRMVREAKSRLTVSIEANTNYELIQVRKDFLELKRKYGPRTAYEQLVDAWLRTTARELGVSYADLAAEEEKVGLRKIQLNDTFGKFGQAQRHPVDHYGFIAPVQEPTRSYKMPEKASKSGKWVDDETVPGQMVWQDDRPDLVEHMEYRSARNEFIDPRVYNHPDKE